jgi:hypothetical protein
MKNLEAVHHDGLVHSYREREVIGRILEQRVSPDVDFVEKDVGQEFRQTEWLSVCDEVDLVPSRGESDTKLRRDCT